MWQLSAILNLLNFDTLSRGQSFGTKFASIHQILFKSCGSRLRNSDKTIFKMATVRHLEIMKFCIFVTWRLSERGSFFVPNFALIGQSIARVRQKTIINMAAVRHFEFVKF